MPSVCLTNFLDAASYPLSSSQSDRFLSQPRAAVAHSVEIVGSPEERCGEVQAYHDPCAMANPRRMDESMSLSRWTHTESIICHYGCWNIGRIDLIV